MAIAIKTALVDGKRALRRRLPNVNTLVARRRSVKPGSTAKPFRTIRTSPGAYDRDPAGVIIAKNNATGSSGMEPSVANREELTATEQDLSYF